MTQKQGSSLVGGPGGQAPWELLHFDVLRTQFHGSKACKIYDQPILGGAYAPYAPLESATGIVKRSVTIWKHRKTTFVCNDKACSVCFQSLWQSVGIFFISNRERVKSVCLPSECLFAF
jgi:hypothetical protein